MLSHGNFVANVAGVFVLKSGNLLVVTLTDQNVDLCRALQS